MHICVLALQGVFDTGLSALLDTFQVANELAAGTHARPPFHVTLAGLRKRAKTQHGLQLPLTALPRSRPDVVIVPALGAKTPEALTPALERRDVADAGAVLTEWAESGALLAAACTGTFVLAKAGLLDGRRATTTWWLAPYFRQRFPLVQLEAERMIVEAGGRVTAGAALSHFDLALWLVRRKSPALARDAAHFLTFDARSSQSAYALQEHLAHADPLVEKFETWARRNLSGFSLDAAAHSVGGPPGRETHIGLAPTVEPVSRTASSTAHRDRNRLWPAAPCLSCASDHWNESASALPAARTSRRRSRAR